jgi:hypothetical protein
MGADVFVAYYGIRYDIPADSPEIEQLELGMHPLMRMADQADLDLWWSGLPNDNETSYPVFVGKQLGIIGGEYDYETQISTKELLETIQQAQMNFQRAGIQEEPKLLLQLEIDA